MENTYLTRVENGETKLYKVNFHKTIDPEVLSTLSVVQTPTPFHHDNRQFTHTIYAECGLVTHVIECPRLLWKMPIKYDERTDKFYVFDGDDDDEKDKQYDVGIQDCVLIVHTGINARYKNNIYITNERGDAVQVTNMYDDGRVCVDYMFDVTTPPQNIIHTLENAKGNNHLLVNRESGNSDVRDAELPMYVHDNHTYALPFTKRKLNHEKTKYIKHIDQS